MRRFAAHSRRWNHDVRESHRPAQAGELQFGVDGRHEQRGGEGFGHAGSFNGGVIRGTVGVRAGPDCVFESQLQPKLEP